jgi:DNA-binding NtrC family response regulator
MQRLVSALLEDAGYDVRSFASAEECLTSLASVLPDAICLDISMPGMNGLEALERIRSHHRMLPVVMLTADTNVDTVVSAMNLGAYDYVPKPIEHAKLVTTMRNAVEHARLSLRLAHLEREADGRGYSRLIGQSPAMRRLFRQLDRLSSSDITVLIHGESGSGKELVARAIHENSGRARGPFVALNCAAIPDSLQEAELFGHEKGAFTGAAARRLGRFEQADGGTIFLDELAELTPAAQAKLLRVLQERVFTRVGGNQEVRTDFRLLAATHRSLPELVKAGSFREDLFFRIAVYELEIPPLRARGDDILLLAQHFVEEIAPPERRPILSPELLAVLRAYEWPGSVRELRNAIERALVTSDGVLRLEDLPERIRQCSPRPRQETLMRSQMIAAIDASGRALSLQEIERQAIELALERHDGNPTRAAEELNIGRATMYRKMKDLLPPGGG